MAARQRPHSLRIRSYQVGFGDCFLLSFRYTNTSRHVLIDFGSTGRPKDKSSKLLYKVANDIKTECGGKLNAVVATHRHKDHIGGFATRKNGKGHGDIIASLKPSVVIQPWTEDPKAKTDARKPTRPSGSRGRRAAFVAGLAEMENMAGAVMTVAPHLKGASKSFVSQLTFMGDNNLSNRSAVENLMRMGQGSRGKYVYCNGNSGLGRVLPGVTVEVLGPPTLEQTETIRKQRSRDEDEFWHLQALAARSFRPNGRNLFGRAETWDDPIWARWLRDRVRNLHADSMMELVRTLDHAMNNTSVILLFKVGQKSFLFPGDAQIENWSYALSQRRIQNLLKKVDVYKVGHHGSLNATPKTLWNLFETRDPDRRKDRLKTINSTMSGKHGDRRRKTEVPRATLVDALEKESDYFSTQSLRGSRIHHDIEIDLRTRRSSRRRWPHRRRRRRDR